MSRHRTTARGALFLIAVLGLAAGANARTAKPVPRLVFPVVGPAQYTDDFGAPRGRSAHQGNDIMAPRKALAVAAEAGKVKFHTTSWAAGCMLYLYGDSGTTYLYIHLNNDLTMRNDNRGKCVQGVAFARGLVPGARVAAGDVIGYVGDSGDANGINPHLHFEVHPNGGRAVSPYPYLRKARKLLFALPPGDLRPLALTGTLVAAADGALQMKVSAVRVLPKGRKFEKLARTVVLKLPATARIETPTGARIALKNLERVPNRAVIVETEPAGLTLAEKLGEAHALWAARVVVRSTS